LNKLVIGIDQSYTRTGISLAVDGKLMKVTSIPFRGPQSHTDKRKQISNIVTHILTKNSSRVSECIIICERIRTFSGGFLSTSYIKATGALIATIVDAAYPFGVKVFSVDTRCWKAAIVGSSKSDGNKKLATIKYVAKLGFDLSSVNKKGKIIYDDDAADSACIALYGFVADQKLKEEH
jgi:hypothetical protein